MERKFRVTVDGRAYEVTVEEMTETDSRLLPQPGDMNVPPPPAAPPAPAASVSAPVAGASDHDLLSPMNGVIESVEVSVGQEVEQGAPVIVIEAMKMKSTLVAHRSGTVTRIPHGAGEAVEAGQVLITIE